MLNSYLKQVQRFTRDASQTLFNPEDLIEYINRARRDIAGRTQCIRALTPISGSISSITLTNGGTGYTAPVVTITPPDFPSGMAPYPGGLQATAEASFAAGIIQDISVTNGGSGYFQPQITITDPTGAGATAVLAGTIGNQTVNSQEVYNFRDFDVSMFPGVGEPIAVHSIAMLFNNWRYVLPCYGFTTYQAMIRQYSLQYQYVPCVFSQYGQGANGSLYMYPIPSSPFQFEADLFCYPQDLLDDNSVEIIPQPWQDAVAFGAAFYAFTEIQNLNSAEYFFKKNDDMIRRFGTYARPSQVQNPYGRAW